MYKCICCVFFLPLYVLCLSLVFAISTIYFSISIIMVFPTECLDEIIVCVFFCCCYNLLLLCFVFPFFSSASEYARKHHRNYQKKNLIKPGIISSTKKQTNKVWENKSKEKAKRQQNVRVYLKTKFLLAGKEK